MLLSLACSSTVAPSAAPTPERPSSPLDPAPAQEPAEPEASVRPGVNDGYTADKLEWFATRFSRDGREVADHKTEILQLLALQPGQRVADIGSGTGLYTRELSAAVGEAGQVYAVDVTEVFLEHVGAIVAQEGLSNVTLVLAEPRDVELAPASVDVAFMSNVYHHVEFPITYMTTVRRALAPGGRLLLIDFHREDDMDDAWVLEHVRAGEATVLDELRRAGFELVARHEIMTRNYVLELRAAAGPMNQ